MFARNFLISLIVSLVLGWALTGYYPFDFEPSPMREFDLIQLIATIVWVTGLLLCGLGGLLASIYCVSTYTGYQTGNGMPSESLTASRMEAVPWAAPFAILWLGTLIFRCLEKIWNTSSVESAFWSGALALLLLMALVVVIRGTFIQLLPRAESQVHS